MHIARNLNRKLNKAPIRQFGFFKDLFGRVRNEQGHLETSEVRMKKGWKDEYDRIENKYFETIPNPKSIFYYSPHHLSNLEEEAIKKNPHIKNKLTTYINSYKDEDSAIIKDFMKKGYLEAAKPMSLAEQQEIIQVLAQEKGEESDYDSDVPVDDEVKYNRRLFNYIKIQDQEDLPPMREEDYGKKTLFIEIEDLLIHTFIPDENIGYISNAASKDPDRTLFLNDAKLNILYYERDYLYEFLEYIDKNFEPILFTSSQSLYADFIVKQFDPENTLFRHKLYQNSCYVMEKKDEDILEFIKDINQYLEVDDAQPIAEGQIKKIAPVKRSAKSSLLLDTRPLNFILNPDNVIP